MSDKQVENVDHIVLWVKFNDGYLKILIFHDKLTKVSANT